MILTFLAVGASMVILIFRRWGRKFGQVHPNRKVSWEILMLVLLAVNTQVTQREGDWSSEIRLWGQTILEEPASLWAWNNLGKAYMDRRRCDLAADAYQKTVELDPGRAENYRNLGTALLCAGNLSAAQKSFEKAIRLAPGDIGSRNNLANLLVVEADQGINSSGYREAIEHYLLILKFDPQNAHAHHNLAWCYLKLGDFNQALAQIGQALFLSPQSEKSLQLKREILSAQKARARKSPERIPAPSE
jgi:tetratricopeptide (TPR) repeat protein